MKFKFSLQPALEKARADREKAEKTLLAARRALADAQQSLDAAEKKLSDLLQRAAAAHDHLVSPPDPANRGRDSAHDLLHRRQTLDALRFESDRQRETVEQARHTVADAQQLAQQRQHELNQTVAQVQSFEKLETKAKQEHQKNLDRKLQDEIDEAAQRRSSN
ncbi:MAG: hypothetical protein AAF333_02430 [Planctomycetota bacterium]